MPSPAESELINALARASALHEQRAASPELAKALDRIAFWQSRRLTATYAHLARDPRYADAVVFFQSDLYGPGDYSRRDADLARVVPLMVRLLPEAVVATVAKAMDLSALSHELDRALAAKLRPFNLSAPGDLTVEAYCDAYRACANGGERQRQIALIVDVGRALDRYVRKPLIRSALTMMRGPARIAGLGALQDFLERGLTAFGTMRGADEFLGALEARETQLMIAMFAGDRRPFPDPLSPGPVFPVKS